MLNFNLFLLNCYACLEIFVKGKKDVSLPVKVFKGVGLWVCFGCFCSILYFFLTWSTHTMLNIVFCIIELLSHIVFVHSLYNVIVCLPIITGIVVFFFFLYQLRISPNATLFLYLNLSYLPVSCFVIFFFFLILSALE